MDLILDRRPTVEAVSGKKRTQIYDEVSRGLFPPPIKIGPRASAWVRHEYQKVLAARVACKNDDEIKALVAELVALRKAA